MNEIKRKKLSKEDCIRSMSEEELAMTMMRLNENGLGEMSAYKVDTVRSRGIMRKILFRGKHIHALPQNEHLDGTWVYGYLCDKNYISTVDEDEYEGKFTSEMLIDPETVCQYTGLTDRNGRKIFEGDIINSDGDIGIVKFGRYQNNFHFGFYVEWMTCQHLRPELGYWNERSSVVGNIFDNPELLKVEE